MTDAALIKVDEAKTALAEALDLTTILEVRDRAQAAHAYASAKGAREAANYAKEIELRARRKAGEFLRDMDPNVGTRGQLVGPGIIGGNKALPPIEPPPPTLAELGIGRMQSSRWQTEANVPEETFEAYVAETVADGKELTANAVYGMAKKLQRQEERERLPDPPPFPVGKFAVIYADPPWSYDNSGFTQSAASHYPTMSTEDICQLSVPELCTPDSVLFLWATSPLLDEAFQVIASWGFTYKASMIWDKGRSPGMGWFVKTEHELLLIATRQGNKHPQEKPASIVRAPVGRHSQKPDTFYEVVESMYAGPYCELFARTPRDNWESWGNEL